MTELTKLLAARERERIAAFKADIRKTPLAALKASNNSPELFTAEELGILRGEIARRAIEALHAAHRRANGARASAPAGGDSTARTER